MFRTATREDPRFGPAYAALAQVLSQKTRNIRYRDQELREGLAAAKKAFILAPEDPDTYLGLAAIKGALGWLEEGLQDILLAVKCKPNDARIHRSCSWYFAYANPPNPQLARFHAEEAIRLDPTMGTAHYQLGRACLMQGDFETARAAFTRASALLPDSVMPRLGWAQFYLAVGRYDEALAALREVLDENPNAVIAHFYRACVFGAMGRTQQARDALLRPIELGFRHKHLIESSLQLQFLTKQEVDQFWTMRSSDPLGNSTTADAANVGSSPFEFDVAISFAGEQRSEAEQIAECLRANSVSVFYDRYSEADLWGKNLIEHLDDLYQRRARFCLMLISEAYAAKAWPTHERRSAQARAIQQRAEYILPVRFDDTPLPGLLSTISYIDFRQHGALGVCRLLLDKLKAR